MSGQKAEIKLHVHYKASSRLQDVGRWEGVGITKSYNGCTSLCFDAGSFANHPRERGEPCLEQILVLLPKAKVSKAKVPHQAPLIFTPLLSPKASSSQPMSTCPLFSHAPSSQAPPHLRTPSPQAPMVRTPLLKHALPYPHRPIFGPPQFG